MLSPQTVELILKWHVHSQPSLLFVYWFCSPSLIWTWVFTPWARPTILKDLSFLCYVLDQSSFFPSTSCCFCMVGDTYRGWNCLHGPYSNLVTGQWARSHSLLKDVCLWRACSDSTSSRNSHLSHYQVSVAICTYSSLQRNPNISREYKSAHFVPERIEKAPIQITQAKEDLFLPECSIWPAVLSI